MTESIMCSIKPKISTIKLFIEKVLPIAGLFQYQALA